MKLAIIQPYFYPLISDFSAYRGLPLARSENFPVAEQIGREVICLPMYPDLSIENIYKIIDIIGS